jgi:hypothetical protein
LLAGDNEKQSEMLQDLQFQVKELAELEAQSTVENAAIQKQSTHTLQRIRSKLDPCTLIFLFFFSAQMMSDFISFTVLMKKLGSVKLFVINYPL